MIGTVKLPYKIMNDLRVAAILDKRKWCRLQRNVLIRLIKVLVIIVENVENTVVGITKKTLEREPPILSKILALIDDHRIDVPIEFVSSLNK